MTDRYYAPLGDVRSSRDDYELLVRFARGEETSVQGIVEALRFSRYWQARGKKAFKEALETVDLLRGEYQPGTGAAPALS